MKNNRLTYLVVVMLADSIDLLMAGGGTRQQLRAALKKHRITPSKGQLRAALSRLRRAGAVRERDGFLSLDLEFRSSYREAPRSTLHCYLTMGHVPDEMRLRAPLRAAA